MSVNGLQKITDGILNDARSQAEEILERARAESEAITARYAQSAEGLRERLSAEAEEKATAFVARTRSSAVAQKNEILLRRRGELVDETFEAAMEQILSMDKHRYAELLGGLAAAAAWELCRTEEDNRRLYGDEDEDLDASLSLILNKNDRDVCGEAVLSAVRKKLTGKIPAEKLNGLALSRNTARIKGGVILCYGEVEYNCSLEMILAGLRRELLGEVEKALFDFRGNGI